MDKQAKLALLKELKSKVTESEEALELLYSVFGSNPEGTIQNAVYGLTTVAVKAAALAIGDNHGWLEWFVYENGWGSEGLEVTLGGKTTNANELEELIEIIDWKEA